MNNKVGGYGCYRTLTFSLVVKILLPLSTSHSAYRKNGKQGQCFGDLERDLCAADLVWLEQRTSSSIFCCFIHNWVDCIDMNVFLLYFFFHFAISGFFFSKRKETWWPTLCVISWAQNYKRLVLIDTWGKCMCVIITYIRDISTDLVTDKKSDRKPQNNNSKGLIEFS